MSAFFYGLALQLRLDIRSKSLLITCYVVPLLFFAIMGGIFTSIDPQAKDTLIQSMSVLGVSMGALIGLPPSIVEVYGGDIKKMYQANGIPLYLGLASMYLSAFIHLMIMSTIIFFVSQVAFGAALMENVAQYFCSLAIFIAVSLGVGSVLGLLVKNQAKLTMLSQLVFLPSIMLSGIMFPMELLPKFFEVLGKVFPATWGFELMTSDRMTFAGIWPLAAVFLLCAVGCGLLLKGAKAPRRN